MEAFLAAPSVTTLADMFSITPVYTAIYGLMALGVTFTLIATCYRKIRGVFGGSKVRL